MFNLCCSEAENGATTRRLTLTQIEGPIYHIFPVGKTNGEKNEVKVGAEYQCEIPDVGGASELNKELEQFEDPIVWDPNKLSEEVVQDYLRKINCNDGKYEEIALWHLHCCNYNVDETIRRYYRAGINQVLFECLWSDEEKSLFEKTFRIRGKDFHAIQKAIRTRTIYEIVDYYYQRKMIARRQNVLNGN